MTAFRYLFGERAFIVNDNDRPDGTHGTLLKAGRLFFGSRELCWQFGTQNAFGIGFMAGYDGSYSVHICLHRLCWLSFSWRMSASASRYPDTTVWECRVNDGSIWLYWACDDNEWPPRWGWQKVIHARDRLFGKRRYQQTVLATHDAVIRFPEGDYPLKVTLRRDSWYRPRWFPRHVHRAEIECLKPIPSPGKGENSWDMDDDATYGMTCPAATVAEAIEHLRTSVQRDRMRYGGRSWVAPVTPADTERADAHAGDEP